MASQNSSMTEAAQLWAVRVGDPDFDDWGDLTAWLEADPAHLAAYEDALESTAWAQRLLAAEPRETHPEFVNDAPALRKRWWGVGGAVAACLALVGAWFVYAQPGGQTIAVPAGEHRTLALADGSQVTLNGGTKLVLHKDAPRQVELANGEALFEIHHNPADPFVVTVGDTRLVDVGTTFNVVGDNGALAVEVAQGAVVYRMGQQQIRLDAGNGLTRASADAAPTLTKADPATVGDWQQGLLQYDDASLTRVARDLGRNLGVQIVAADGAENMRFTGTLVVSGTPAEVFARAGALMGVKFERQGDGWRITPTHEARR